MDKSWMDKARNTQAYIDGVEKFIDFAFTHSARGNTILCPCRICLNCCWFEASVVYEHLLCDGFISGYKRWIYHGEASSPLASESDHDEVQPDNFQEEIDLDDYDEMLEMIQDIAHQNGDFSDSSGEDPSHQDAEPEGVDPFLEKKKKKDEDAFRQFIADDREELYLGCTTFSKLHFVVRLLHVKSLGGWSDKSFDILLELLKEAFPTAKLPKFFYESKKMIKCLELGYIKIHACENDCILFWKEHANKDICPTCKTSRWKSEKNSLDGKHVHKVPRKVLRYFPIKKRLQCLFVSPKSAADCRWHAEERTRDGLIRHTTDAPVWKDFDGKYPDFSKDSRNMRLLVVSDGFNPFRTMKLSYSIWPVVVILLNLPPWLCMKQHNSILSLLIPGPRSPIFLVSYGFLLFKII
ncbi:uncharacterized protein LOC125551358 isoform X2 [Triticum urartu]|uniref:uncharacterized protein LOC125551358 isoform X2 n=1 Tax=Triticum urartu TaxID=4572 RepID=UPI002043A0C1|nr:uncharacterized protein LOC125551358 isoform X2 [Triticum urartu]